MAVGGVGHGGGAGQQAKAAAEDRLKSPGRGATRLSETQPLLKTSRVLSLAVAATFAATMSMQQADAFNSCSPMPGPPGQAVIAWQQGEIQLGEIVVVARGLTEPDWDKVRAFVRRTSRESLRLRFGQAADFRDERTLRRFVDINGGGGEMIWVLEEGGAICAMAHLVRLSPEQAEIALIVRSDRVRRGIGERLLRITLARAAQHDLKTLTALVLYENTAMLRLARKLGFEVRTSSGLTVELELDLGRIGMAVANGAATSSVIDVAAR
jgi:L-amino acid N-acyltransferase YncA